MKPCRTYSLSSKLVSIVTAGAIAGSLLAPAAWAQGAKNESTASEAKASSPDAAKPKPSKKTKDEARKTFEQGQKFFKSGSYSEAEASFRKANSILPTPHAEYWIAMSLAGQESSANEAISALEAFLNNLEKVKVGEQKVADATAKLAELKAKQLGEVELTTDPQGASVSVDGVAQAGLTPMTLKLLAGKHKLDISAMDYAPKVVEIEVVAGKPSESKLTLQPLLPPLPPPVAAAPAPTPATPAPSPVSSPPTTLPKRSLVPAYVTLGLAGAGLVVGGIFGVEALGAKSDFNDNPTAKNADKVERNALISDMAFGVAVTLGLTGVVLLTSPEADEAGASEAASASFQFTPYVTTQGGGAQARLTF